MKGFGFIAVLAAMVILGILTVSKLKKKSAASLEKANIEAPTTLPELPSAVKQKLDGAAKQAEDRTKNALEGVE